MLSQQILKTLQYFDIQDHPLTLLEIKKYLLAEDSGRQAALSSILNCLDNELAGKVQNKYGFYFLHGRESVAENRWQNNFYSVLRLKKAKRILPLARFVPFIAAVALTGSEARGNSKQGSDIDLLVLTEVNRIWLGRLFLTAFFQALGMRRHGNKIADRFCLNHYVRAGKVLDADKNIYTAVEYVSLIPFYGGDSVYDFQQKNIFWIKNYLAEPLVMKIETPEKSRFAGMVERLFANPAGDWLENAAGKYQKSRIKAQQNIVIENDELSFHPGSKGRQVLSRLPFK